LSSNEIRRLFAKLILTVEHADEYVLAWSNLRRLCIQRTRDSHYRKRLERLEGYEPP
jgi:hypothetical protein